VLVLRQQNLCPLPSHRALAPPPASELPASPTWSPKVCNVESYAPQRLPGGALHCKGLALLRDGLRVFMAELCCVHPLAQVVSKKAEKTVIVAVEQLKTHRIYGKRMRQTHRFQACICLTLACVPPQPQCATYLHDADSLVALLFCCAASSTV